MKREWKYTGDVNPVEYGGTWVAKDTNGGYEFVNIATSEDKKFLFHGTVCWPEDHFDADFIKEAASEFGYSSPEEFLKEDPANFINEVISGFGCGIFEFSPTNVRGQGAYSMRWEDFEATEEEIRDFLKELEIEE